MLLCYGYREQDKNRTRTQAAKQQNVERHVVYVHGQNLNHSGLMEEQTLKKTIGQILSMPMSSKELVN
jgi:hypothetical protein